MKTGSLPFAVTAMAMSLVQAAGAATTPSAVCITSTELRAGMAYLVPAMIRGVREKCTTILPRDAYLNKHGDELITRFQASRMTDTKALQSLVGKIQPNPDVPASANGAMADVIAATLVAKMQATIKPTTCPGIDKTLALLDPLPAENVVGLFELIGSAVTKDDARKSKAKGRLPDVQLCEHSK
ncbi:hypothetical protein D3Y57_06365 [Sphingomonas paeninsulae]|uniref:Uncharacterized protein n=1 Tax=Sphingomonas paeninsulae TaxID=2319844 RepID=A0A494TEG1_SPHPE|nr:hypothetical protein [Sphingomonas paeninsulae]AYJ85662.1 hypothetical protein D3Y57_06365 [Sphingomonas paeninsulae]